MRSVAAKYLDRLNAPDKNRLKDAFENLGKEPPEGDIRSLAGQKGKFRLRVGGFRALYQIESEMILVTNIDQREKMTSAALRKKIHVYIDALPDRSLSALKPILTVLAESTPKYTIETDLTPDEIAMIDEGMAEYRNDPSSWVPLENIQ